MILTIIFLHLQILSPALNIELFSNCVTASTTASMLLPPPWRTVYPARAAAQTPSMAPSDFSFGIKPAPPWTTTTGNIVVTRQRETVDKPTHNWFTCINLGTHLSSAPSWASHEQFNKCRCTNTHKHGRYVSMLSCRIDNRQYEDRNGTGN